MCLFLDAYNNPLESVKTVIGFVVLVKYALKQSNALHNACNSFVKIALFALFNDNTLLLHATTRSLSFLLTNNIHDNATFDASVKIISSSLGLGSVFLISATIIDFILLIIDLELCY